MPFFLTLIIGGNSINSFENRYRIGNRKYSKEVKTSPFSLPQLQPGELVITSIAHQQKSCKATVTDIRYTIHPLPSAKVGQGQRVIQDIHEGLLLRFDGWLCVSLMPFSLSLSLLCR